MQRQRDSLEMLPWDLGIKGVHGGSTAISIHLSGKFPFRLTIINRKPAAAVT